MNRNAEQVATSLSFSLNTNSKRLKRPLRKRRVGLDFWKCYFCRRDKQKCQPNTRQWPGERCLRCIQKNFACSEPQRVKDVTRIPSNTTSLPPREPQQPMQTTMSIGEAVPTGMDSTIAFAESNRRVVKFSDGQSPSWAKLQVTPVEECNVPKLQNSPILFDLRNIVVAAISELEKVAKGMAEVFDGDRTYKEYITRVDDVFAEYVTFLKILDQRIRSTPYDYQLLLDEILDPYLPAPNLGVVDSEAIQHMDEERVRLEELGYCGRTYSLLTKRLFRYPKTATDTDRNKQNRVRCHFHLLILNELQHAQFEPYVPQYLSTASIFVSDIPWRFFDLNPPIFELLDLDGHDYLGRSASHILSDAGCEAYWPQEHINRPDVLGRTAMYFACRNGDESLVEKLIKSDAVIDRPIVTGFTPLHVAAVMGYTSICERILNKETGGSLTVLVEETERDCAGRTPLLGAVSKGHYDTVRLFCERTVGNRHNTDSYGTSAMTLAVQSGYVDIVRCLLDHKFAADIPDAKGRTPFWYAVQGSRYEIMKKLSKVVETDYKDQNGRTPLAEAARLGLSRSVRLLLGLNRYDEYSRLGDHSQLRGHSRLVLDLKADPTSEDNEGKSPLILAAEARNTDCVKLLVEHKPCHYCGKDLAKAREIARAQGDKELLNILINGYIS